MELNQHKPNPGDERALIAHRLCVWMEDGTFQAGAPLPSERVLAQRLGTSRGMVRGALRVLRERGLVEGEGARRVVARAAPNVLSDVVALISSAGLDRWPREGGTRFVPVDLEILMALENAGWQTLLLQSSHLESSSVSGLQSMPPAGAIVGEVSDHLNGTGALAERLREAGVATVSYGEWPQLRGCDRVSSDHEAGSYALTRWMIERGRERIVQVWGQLPTSYWFGARDRGYRRAMEEAGLPVRAPIRVPDAPLWDDSISGEERRAGFEASVRVMAGHLIEHLLGEGGADALLVHTDTDCPYVLAACRLCGREPNRDVWVAGYDNAWRELHQPDWEAQAPLVTVDKNHRLIARALVETLRARRDGELPAEPILRLVPPTLIEVEPRFSAPSPLLSEVVSS